MSQIIWKCLLEINEGMCCDAPTPEAEKLQVEGHGADWHSRWQPVTWNWGTQRSNKEVKRQVRPARTTSGMFHDGQVARQQRVSQEEGKMAEEEVGTYGCQAEATNRVWLSFDSLSSCVSLPVSADHVQYPPKLRSLQLSAYNFQRKWSLKYLTRTVVRKATYPIILLN